MKICIIDFRRKRTKLNGLKYKKRSFETKLHYSFLAYVIWCGIKSKNLGFPRHNPVTFFFEKSFKDKFEFQFSDNILNSYFLPMNFILENRYKYQNSVFIFYSAYY